MKIRNVPLHELKPYENNVKQHPVQQLEVLVKSIKRYGFRGTVLIDKNNVIVAGHARYEAASVAGLTEIPCESADDLTEAQITEFRILDNEIASMGYNDVEKFLAEAAKIPDFDFSEFHVELPDPVQQVKEGECDEDETPELKIESCSKTGDIWLLEDHRLMCGDSTMIDEVEKLMAGNKADLWLTDPPYGVSYADKNKFLNAADKGNRNQNKIENDHHSLEEMTQFWKSVASNTLLVTSDKCSYYWFACQGGDQMMMMIALSESQWKVRHELIWVKNNHVLGRCDYHYKHEPILYGWKKDGTHEFFGDSSNFSVLNFDKPTKSEMHPTMKPVELLELLITNNSKNGYLVIDTFGGSGSTLIACEKTNRKCFMMEISPAYCDVIVKRWQKFSGKEAVLESTGKKFNELSPLV